jgi:DNA invertase Pin-like site-specific DNA recombinase
MRPSPTNSRLPGVRVRNGWSVAQEYSDAAMSGATILRAGFQGLMRDALAKRFDVVVAESLDRFSRDQEDTQDCSNACRSPASGS